MNARREREGVELLVLQCQPGCCGTVEGRLALQLCSLQEIFLDLDSSCRLRSGSSSVIWAEHEAGPLASPLHRQDFLVPDWQAFTSLDSKAMGAISPISVFYTLPSRIKSCSREIYFEICASSGPQHLQAPHK